MPFERLTLEFTCFFTLISLLTSLPTEPHANPWHQSSSQDRQEAYRITQSHTSGTPRRGNGNLESHFMLALGSESARRNRNEMGSLESHQFRGQGSRQRDGWPRPNPRSRHGEFSDRPQVGPVRSDPEAACSPAGEGRSGTDDPDATDGTYSSHVNCQVTNQNDTGTGTSPVQESNGENVTLHFVVEEEEKINFDESFRNLEKGDGREGEASSSGVIAPKSTGRRPGHAGTNTITAEKTHRNQTQQKGPKRPRPITSKPQGGQIVFPDVYRRQKFTPKGTKCGKKATFCEHIGDDYPSDYINQILKKEGAMFREFFGKDMVSDPNITERIHAPEENSLCPFRQEVVFPRAAKNKDDKWLFVVNQDQYVQGVTVEVCLNPESRCILTEGFPLGYVPYCKQKYIERRLVAIGEDGKPHSDSFRLPSCCSCVVKHESSARMASLRSSRNTSPAVET